MKRVLNVAVAVALLFGGYMWGHMTIGVVHAQDPKIYAVPKAWGHVVGITPNYELVYEDSTGTIRMANLSGYLMDQVNRN
jgi:hypothetical protein